MPTALKIAEEAADLAQCATMAAVPDQAEALRHVLSPADKVQDRATAVQEAVAVAEAKVALRSTGTRLAEVMATAELQGAITMAIAAVVHQAETPTQEALVADHQVVLIAEVAAQGLQAQ